MRSCKALSATTLTRAWQSKKRGCSEEHLRQRFSGNQTY